MNRQRDKKGTNESINIHITLTVGCCKIISLKIREDVKMGSFFLSGFIDGATFEETE